MNCEAGELSHRDITVIGGVAINPVLPTRGAEFSWALETITAHTKGIVLDAGTGFGQTAHVLPYILAKAGCTVLAVDSNPLTLEMLPHDKVIRMIGDIRQLPTLQPESFNAWTCISVLEHMHPIDRQYAIEEGYRLLQTGGILAITADELLGKELNALVAGQGFRVGPVVPRAGEPLTPWVGYCVAQKPGTFSPKRWDNGKWRTLETLGEF